MKDRCSRDYLVLVDLQASVLVFVKLSFFFCQLGVPAAAEILGLPKETNNTKITLRWSEPENNGKPIKNYTVYQRTVKEDGTHRAWNRISVITDLSDLQVTVRLEKGKIYEFVVTATNEFGESLKEEKKRKNITVEGGKLRGIMK